MLSFASSTIYLWIGYSIFYPVGSSPHIKLILFRKRSNLDIQVILNNDFKVKKKGEKKTQLIILYYCINLQISSRYRKHDKKARSRTGTFVSQKEV